MTTAAVLPAGAANHNHETPPRPMPKPISRTLRAELFDRRRRQGRDLAETLVNRAEYLLPEDRALLNAIYRDGVSVREIADLTGSHPRTVRLRIRKLAQRALDPRFTFVLTHRDQWPQTRRLVATENILHGHPLRETARQLNLSLHAVRRHADAIRVMYEALGR